MRGEEWILNKAVSFERKMSGVVSEEAVGMRSVESFANGHHSQSGEALAEWRSSEQVENGTPSTSPPYWDTDDDDDDAGMLLSFFFLFPYLILPYLCL